MKYRVLSGRAAVTLLSLALLATACSATQQMHGSLVKAYASLADLRDDSDAVVIASPQSAVTDTLNGVPVTITRVNVVDVVTGTLDERSILIQQFGTNSVASPDTSLLLQAGRQYLLFVVRFHLVPGDQTGRYVVTGDQGAFELRQDQYVYVGAAGPSTLPQSIGASQVRQTVSPDSTN
jgi:hypothetical protein